MGGNLPNMPTYSPTYSSGGGSSESLLRVTGLCKRYTRGSLWRKRVAVAAVVSADFEILRGQTLALVGESGSGKSTVARCVARVERPDAGQILIHGRDIARLSSHELLPFRSGIQMVFQDPVTSMNPRFSALEVIEESMLMDRHASANAEKLRDRQNHGDQENRRNRAR